MERFAEHAWSDFSLIPYGYGDGGGGPTREMLARASRLADLDPMPHVELGSAARFFEHVEAEAAAGAPVPVWRGELYFETHRGTLTSQLRTKLGNRRCERLLRETELWAATAALAAWTSIPTSSTGMAGGAHPAVPRHPAGLRRSPGSTPTPRRSSTASPPTSSSRIAARLADLAPNGDVVANAATFDRAEVIATAAPPPGDGPTQQLPDGRVAAFVTAPGLGLAPLIAAPLEAGHGGRRPQVVVTDRSMSNGRLAVSWGLDGTLTSVIDIVRGRELIPRETPAAELLLAPDRPVQYDAWDLESWTVDASAPVGHPDSVDVVAAGPLVGIVAVHAVVRPVVGGRPLRPARRVAAPRRRDRPRLAARRAPVVDPLPPRCARRHRQLRHPVRGRAPSHARLDHVGCRQVRGVCPSVRRRRRARLRRRRAQQRALRARPVRRIRPCQPRAGGEVPRPRCRSWPAHRDARTVPARSGPRRRGRRGGTARPAATCRRGEVARWHRKWAAGTGGDRDGTWRRGRCREGRRRRQRRHRRPAARGHGQSSGHARWRSRGGSPLPRRAICWSGRTISSRSPTVSAH